MRAFRFFDISSECWENLHILYMRTCLVQNNHAMICQCGNLCVSSILMYLCVGMAQICVCVSYINMFNVYVIVHFPITCAVWALFFARSKQIVWSPDVGAGISEIFLWPLLYSFFFLLYGFFFILYFYFVPHVIFTPTSGNKLYFWIRNIYLSMYTTLWKSLIFIETWSVVLCLRMCISFLCFL